MFGKTKKIPNPEVKAFEDEIKARGITLSDGMMAEANMSITDRQVFLSFARYHNVPIFREFYMHEYTYFCLIDGAIVTTQRIDEKVKER